MRLNASSYLILGMLDRGVETGYSIKRAVDRSTRSFWAPSLAQVYPALATLEADGYVVSTDEPRGARPRKAYRLTDKGRRALDRWLNTDRAPHFDVRDEGLLRLFFADAMPPDEAFELVRRMRRRAEELDRELRARVVPHSEGAPGRFPAIVARHGADYLAWRAAWFRHLEDQLSDEVAAHRPEYLGA